MLVKENGSMEFGDAEKIEVCANGSIDQVDEEESFQFDQGSSQHEESSFPILKLRGGAGAAKSKRLDDDERVPPAVWFFAGKMGPPPTGKQLRDRREKEEAYVERKREERKAKRELKKAGAKLEDDGEGKEKGSGRGGFWKKMFAKKKTDKTRGDEEKKRDVTTDASEKEVAEDSDEDD